MANLVRASVPYPSTSEELVSLVREIDANHKWVEIFIRRGEPISFVYEDSRAQSIDLTPYDLARMFETREVVVGDIESEITASPDQVIRELFESLEEAKVWPICFIVDDYQSFASWLGFDAVRARSRRLYGLPILHDSRVADGVVYLCATPGQRDGYGQICYSVFTHYKE